MNALTFPFALALLAETIARHWDTPAILLGKVLVIATLVGLNGFFVACEFAIIKVRASQLDELAEEGNERARFIKYIRAHLDAYLSATQLGVTLASLALGWIGEQFDGCANLHQLALGENRDLVAQLEGFIHIM